MKRVNKILIIVLIMAIALIQIYSFAATTKKEERPKEGTDITYWYPNWLTDDKIIYLKQTDYYRYRYDWLAEVAKARAKLIKCQFQLCSLDINTNEEKVIVEAILLYPRNKPARYVDESTKFISWPHSVGCSYKTEMIIVTSSEGGIFTLKYDGSGIKKIIDNAVTHNISPDGKRLLVYKFKEGSEKEIIVKRKSALIITNMDGNTLMQIGDSEKYSQAVWHSEGDKIIFSRKDAEPIVREIKGERKEFYKSKTYILNLEDGKEELFFEGKSVVPTDWSMDGSKVLIGRIIFEYDKKEQKLEKLNAIKSLARNLRLSPDGTKVIGEDKVVPIEEEGVTGTHEIDGLYVVNSDDTEPRLLISTLGIRYQ